MALERHESADARIPLEFTAVVGYPIVIHLIFADRNQSFDLPAGIDYELTFEFLKLCKD
jgi:hypothetical protein